MDKEVEAGFWQEGISSGTWRTRGLNISDGRTRSERVDFLFRSGRSRSVAALLPFKILPDRKPRNYAAQSRMKPNTVALP